MPTPTNESLRVTVARIEEKVDVLITQRGDQETRLRSLEKWRYGLPASVLIGLAGLITAVARGHS